MKKTIALLMTLALVISAVALPALAEEPAGTVDQVTSATRQSGQNNQFSRGGRGGRQQMPGQNSQNGQAPQTPGQNGQNSRMPGRGGKGNRQGGFTAETDGQTVKHGKTAIFDRLLADGVITQEIYDAIIAWMQQQAPQARQNAEAPAEGTAPAEGSEPPALPDSTASDGSASAQEELLKTLLDTGVITQEQYDLLVSALQTPPAPPAAPAAQADTLSECFPDSRFSGSPSCCQPMAVVSSKNGGKQYARIAGRGRPEAFGGGLQAAGEGTDHRGPGL